jgi:hypothetical protein
MEEEYSNKRIRFSVSLENLGGLVPPLPSPTDNESYSHVTHTFPKDDLLAREKLVLELVSKGWEVVSVSSDTIRVRRRNSF